MKAQLSFEYYASLTIFILFIAYVFFQIVTLTPQFEREVKNEIMRSEVYQISELLINDPGHPLDWPTKTVKRVGLSSNLNKTNFISLEKVNSFETKCNQNYENIKNLIGTEYYFSVDLIDITSGQKLITCKPTQSIVTQSKISIVRLVAIDSNDIGELTVQLW
jgi:hypothetical protein